MGGTSQFRASISPNERLKPCLNDSEPESQHFVNKTFKNTMNLSDTILLFCVNTDSTKLTYICDTI